MSTSKNDTDGASPVEEPLFTFAIITDTHIRPPGGDDSSPFAVNDLANGRARYAAAKIAAHKPDFTLHLGDMVHPLPHLPTYGPAAEEALKILKPLGPDLHFVPGNHDVGDKPMPASPAGPVDDHSVALFEKYFGAGHAGFEQNGVQFIIINSSLVNSGSAHEDAQRIWLEEYLTAHAGERTFLFSHYPPMIDQPDEHSHYDNYDEPGRSWLLELVRQHKIEAVFSGHVHQFFFNRVEDAHLYCLPPTSFTRQDYSELYDVEPADQFGRNDEGKFSYALVDVFREGHKLRVYPTDGEGLAESKSISLEEAPGEHTLTPLTLHLRHGWARARDLPYNGPMEEFTRKRARNDYALQRLWQMGITRVRTPLSDLFDHEYGPRVHDFHAAGCTFTFFHSGVPDADLWKRCNDNAHLIDAVEFVTFAADASDIADDLAAFDCGGGPPVYLGKSHSSADEPKEGSKFAHSVSFGFKWEDRQKLLPAFKMQKTVRGVVFQVNLQDDLQTRLAEIERFAEENELLAAANIRLAHISPAIANFDDAAIVERVAEAVAIAPRLERTNLQLDTFADIDRGYHPRHGLLDRRFNFRTAGRFLMERHMYGKP